MPFNPDDYLENLEKPDEAPKKGGFNPDDYAEKPQDDGSISAAAAKRSLDAMAAKFGDTGGLKAAGAGAVSGATFGQGIRAKSGFEALTGIEPTYSEALAKNVAAQEERKKAHPNWFLGGELAGGLGTGVGMARSGLTLTREGTPIVGRMLTGTAEGALQGAAAGAGGTYSGKPDEYFENLKRGMMGGAAGGAAGTAVGAGVGAAYRSFADRFGTSIPTPLARSGRVDVDELVRQRNMPGAMLPDAG